ncbi:mevalonate kinase [Winogradskyella wandonensis]|uniref:Mevalonate kinase n=1 Tax=Winogradskyella wandonensis TaxID=1442586 RepID=A0A4R1KQS4_9FLAO|nr:GYDIA family GHMP kinase [Winogradskyella wandonensis]TCK67415.1 mevalonate kinase [Winogradskyella wandonensis]
MEFKSNGKLLLTGEYLVLNGAKAMALPTRFGQSLIVDKTKKPIISWVSYDETNAIWFKEQFSISQVFSNTINPDNDVSERLIQIFKSIKKLNPKFLNSNFGYNIKTTQDFNRSWGLGTSSTLINNLASWANVNAYDLLELTFGGSGYDIACAQSDSAIIYQLEENKPNVTEVKFSPPFKDNIYFVYLNQKQNSRDGIKTYRAFKGDLLKPIKDINALTEALLTCCDLKSFEDLITTHEEIVAKIINQKPVKQRLFNDFDGAVKSLGAWGGDFVLVTANENPKDYFNSKGYNTVISFLDMIKA